MARGFKTGGRQKGSKNKRTLMLEGAARELIANAGDVLGENAFDGDAHALLILTYKNKALPLELRVDAAKAAIRFEKPALSSVDSKATVENTHYTISDVPLSETEWAEQHATSH